MAISSSMPMKGDFLYTGFTLAVEINIYCLKC